MFKDKYNISVRTINTILNFILIAVVAYTAYQLLFNRSIVEFANFYKQRLL